MCIRDSGNLRVPRDELRHAFVLRPLAEIAPDIVEPRSGRTLAQLWADSPERGVPMAVVQGFDAG
jgi:2-amino-4-hydroxy-6-hydroxymethyldihydropteridine diphosphokinase